MANIERLILASGSPFRRQLLESLGVTFEVMTGEVDESAIVADEPADLASLRAEAKAVAVALAHPHALVIGADQVASVGGMAFDKVDDEAAACERLASLSDRCHFLHSAFCLVMATSATSRPRVLASTVVDIPMLMRQLTPEDIEAYIATGEWRGSVGCYKIEKRGICLFKSVDADSSAIVGLPLVELTDALRGLGIDIIRQPHPPWVLI